MNDNPASILFDYFGNPYGVSGSMALPTGSIGQLIAGVDNSGIVQYVTVTSGSLSVTGSLAATIVFPADQLIQGTVNVYTSGPQAVTGSVNVYTSGPQSVSGSVALTNWPAVLGVSSSAPLVINAPQPVGVTGSVGIYTSGLQGISGSVTVGTWGTNVTASVQISGVPQVSGAVALTNWPAVIGVSSSAPLTINAPQPVGVTGSVALTNWPATLGVSSSSPLIINAPQPVGVSGSVALTNWPAILGISSSAPLVINAPQPVGVTGSVALTNWPAAIGVSSSTATGLVVSGTVNSQLYGIVSNTFSGSQGQAAILTTTYQGFLQNTEMLAPVYEDNFSGIAAVALKPITASLYCPTFSGSMQTLPAVVKASPGTLYRVWVTNRSTGSIYLTLHNSTTGPSGVPLAAYPINAISGSGGGANNGNLNPGQVNSPAVDFSPWGIFFSVGISIGLSSSPATYTAVANPSGGVNFDSSVMFI